MIEVELPDGTIAEFPDGTSQAVITSALRKRFAPTKNTNPGVSPDAPPGMFLNPQTGQYTSRELLSNAIATNQTPSAMGATIAGAGRGATFGGIDELTGHLNAAIPGSGNPAERNTFGREHVRAYEEAATKTNPDDMLTSEIAGAVSVPIMAPFQAGSLLARGAGNALSGGIAGGLYGGLTGEGEERLERAESGAKWGAGAGVLAALLGAGVQKTRDAVAARRGLREASRNAQSAAAKRAESGRAYDAFEGADVQLSPDAITRLRTQLEGRLPREGLVTLPGAEARTSGGRQILDVMRNMDDQVQAAASAGQNPAVPLRTIDDLRQVAGDVAQDVNSVGRATKDARLGAISIDEIDNFIDGLKSSDVVVGDVGAAREALQKARSVWKTAAKTQVLENILSQQDNYLGGAASAIRNQIATLLRNPKTRKQFTEAEQRVLRNMIGGNFASRAIRLAGNGIGRQMQAAGGAAAGGVPGVLAGLLTGELSMAMANRNAVRAAERARDVMANGGIQRLATANPEVTRVIEALVRRAGVALPQQ